MSLAEEVEPLMTTAELAVIFKCDPKTISRWVTSGKLASIRTPGGRHRFKESDVRALLAGDSQGKAA